MRTQTHTTLQISTLLAVAALVGGFFGLKNEVEGSTDLLLVAPIVFFIIGGQYMEVSYQVYIAEAYVNQVVRPSIQSILYASLAPDDHTQIDHDVLRDIVAFEWWANEHRQGWRSVVLGGLKGVVTVVLPVAVFLGIFIVQKPMSDWGAEHFIAVVTYIGLALGFVLLAFIVHRRRGALSLRGGWHPPPRKRA